jgi:hypothetical protein
LLGLRFHLTDFKLQSRCNTTWDTPLIPLSSF